jgi:hypothetical protein
VSTPYIRVKAKRIHTGPAGEPVTGHYDATVVHRVGTNRWKLRFVDSGGERDVSRQEIRASAESWALMRRLRIPEPPRSR